MNLSDSEIIIMHVIWKYGEATVFDVLEEIQGKVASNSARTLLGRMVKKGAIGIEKKDGKTYIYKPLISKKEFQREKLKEFFELVYEGKYFKICWDIKDLRKEKR